MTPEVTTEHLASFPELNPNPVVEVSAEGKILYANPAALAQFPDLIDRAPDHPFLGQWAEVFGNLQRDPSGSLARDLQIGARWYEQVFYCLRRGEACRVYARDITRRKEAEASLQASEQRWMTTLASIGDAVIATDKQARITFMNSVAEDLTGWTLADARGKPVQKVFIIASERTGKRITDPFAKILQTGRTIGLANHTILIGRDGTSTPIDDSGSPIRNAGGEIEGSVIVFRDITERKKNEDELERRARRLAVLHKTSREISGTLDPRTVGKEVLASVLEILKVDGGGLWLVDWEAGEMEFLAHNYCNPQLTRQINARRRWPIPDSATGLAARTGQAKVGEGLAPQAFEFYPAFASLGRKFVTAIPLKAEQRVVGVVSVLSSEKPEVSKLDWEALEVIADMAGIALSNALRHQQVEASRKHWQQTFDSMSDGLVIMDLHHTILRANAAMANLLHSTPGALIGKKCYDVMHGLEHPLEGCPTPACIATHEPSEVEIKEPRLGDRWFRVRVDPVRGPSGAVVGIVHNIRDITERKATQNLKDEFLGMLSHEMKTPLTVMIGSLHTAIAEADSLSPAERDTLVKDAYVEAESLADVMNNLLELTRAQAGRLALKAEPFDLQATLESVLARARGQHPGSLFKMNVPASIPALSGDRTRIERVLYNLVDNGAKYSPPGSVVRVCAESEDGELLISVSDHGPGIAPEDLRKLFTPFERLGRDSAGSTGGTGLGLVVARRLAEAHGGRVWAESEVGKGSTFFFALPVNGPVTLP